MREIIRLLAQRLWPMHGSASLRSDTDLNPLIVLLLVLVAGPDLLAAMEFTSLLELLGASLFLLAFATGFRMLVWCYLSCLRAFLVPPGCAALLRLPAKSPRTLAFMAISWNAAVLLLVFVFLPYDIYRRY